jgi:hypothetical protein
MKNQIPTACVQRSKLCTGRSAIALLTSALALLVAGCSSIIGSRQLADGSRLTISAQRLLWASEGIDTTVVETNGLSFSLKVEKSNVDSQALGAVTEAAVKAAIQGAK